MNEDTDNNLRSITLKQSLRWAKRNCTPEAVQRLRSRAVVTRLVEEVEKLQTLLQAIKDDLDEGYYISNLITQVINTYFAELDKS